MARRPDNPRPGLLVIDKPAGITSHDVVSRVRRLAKTRKVGHGGTLDPMATGVLVVGVGKATKLLTWVGGHSKEYVATIRFGIATNTDDAEGVPTRVRGCASLSGEDLERALAPLRGDIMQVPTTVSAIKVGGKRAYALARAGEDVTLAARPVRVSRLEVLAPPRPAEATEAEAATLASNSAPANTARTTLTVSVGDGASGNATDGHFDLGPAIENGTLVARVKDDRTQPAQWVDPSSLTFALGDAARITAPADLGFVATPGSSVWLIPSTQIAGVPWLGLNSQREEIVTGTTGPVQFTLDAVEGPGRVAVFNAGALGSGVGEHVFDGPGTGYTLGANTHAHQNWVFTAPGTYTLTITMRVTPNGAALAGSGFGSGGDLTATGATGPNGRPMVSQVVGRTASGKECDLSLATTGADTIPLTVVSLTWAPTGAACVWVGAIGRRRNLCKAP